VLTAGQTCAGWRSHSTARSFLGPHPGCRPRNASTASRTVTVQGGIRAPALERHLAKRGLTLGHYPQSFEYVSLGGCAATRSAGQASSGYGAIERMVRGMRAVAPAGARKADVHDQQVGRFRLDPRQQLRTAPDTDRVESLLLQTAQ